MTPSDFPSTREIDRIAASGDPVLRNLQITQAYYELSRAMTERMGPEANWCTFATWASKQAGQSIRKEDLRRSLERMVRDLLAPPTDASADPSAAGSAAPSLPQDALQAGLDLRWTADRVADAVARGNRKVFLEIGRIFAGFLAEFLSTSSPEPGRLEDFCRSLHPGDPPDGQRLLQSAFSRYHRAFFTTDPQIRAELLYFANLEIGFHEQTRLQPEIAEALNAATINLQTIARVLAAAGPLYPAAWLRLPLWWARRRLGHPAQTGDSLEAFFSLLQKCVRLTITDLLMTIRFPPDRIIRLGEDLPAEAAGPLRRINDPELIAFLAPFDAQPDIAIGSGAHDWGDLPDRLQFIAHLFRGYQDAPELLAPPFLPEQVSALQAGKLPTGSL